MDGLLEQVQTLASKLDSAGRRKALVTLRALQLQLETPHDTLQRLFGLHLEITAARIGEDLSLFQMLVDERQPMTTAELATKTGAAPVLLSRILRYLAAAGMIRETAAGTFGANAITETLALPGHRGSVRLIFDMLGPILQAFPDFLKEHKYQDVTDQCDTAFQRAFSTDLSLYAWMETRPQHMELFYQFMGVLGPETDWISVFPFADEIKGFNGPTVLVDVGGGSGHQCQAILASFPQLTGKLVVQDLPATLAMAPTLEGIRTVVHDFFKPQPERGARFYFVRHVMVDWSDDQCSAILEQLRDAMGPESQILIDDKVLPPTGSSLAAAAWDLAMLSTQGSRERTLDEWKAVLDASGLSILRTYSYGDSFDSIIQCVAKKDGSPSGPRDHEHSELVGAARD